MGAPATRETKKDEKKPEKKKETRAEKPKKPAPVREAVGEARAEEEVAIADARVETLAGRIVIIRKKPGRPAGLTTDEEKELDDSIFEDGRAKPAKKVRHEVRANEKAAGPNFAVDLKTALAKVESAIAEWKRADKGAAGTARENIDDVRLPDGRLDLAKVEVWIVTEWKTPAPRRVRLSFPPNADVARGIDWQQGASLVARGKVDPLAVDPAIELEGGEVATAKVEKLFADALPDMPLPPPGSAAPSPPAPEPPVERAKSVSSR